MSVATKNPFAILDSEDASRPPTPATEPTKKAQAPPPASAPSRGNPRSRGGPGSRGGRYYPRGGGARAAPKDVDQPQNGQDESSAEPRKLENGGRGRGRGRGGDRGGRGGRRPFDRHSQTGKTDSDKKFHQGWGGDDGNQEFKAEQAASVDVAVEADTWTGETSQADWGSGEAAPAEPAAPAAADEDKDKERAENKPRREEEEEDTTLTLDQYYAKKEKESAVPKLEGTRKANEGADDTYFKDATPLTKDEAEQSYFVGKTKSTPKARAAKEGKVFLEIEAHFDRPDRGGRGRGRGDRGGRGERGRGGRGRGGGGGGGGGRGGRQNGPITPEINDEAAFPSLS